MGEMSRESDWTADDDESADGFVDVVGVALVLVTLWVAVHFARAGTWPGAVLSLVCTLAFGGLVAARHLHRR